MYYIINDYKYKKEIIYIILYVYNQYYRLLVDLMTNEYKLLKQK